MSTTTPVAIHGMAEPSPPVRSASSTASGAYAAVEIMPMPKTAPETTR